MDKICTQNKEFSIREKKRKKMATHKYTQRKEAESNARRKI